MKERNYNYEIVEHIGTIYTSEKGWTFELNIIDWGKGSKYDFRCWSPDHKPNKGGDDMSGKTECGMGLRHLTSKHRLLPSKGRLLGISQTLITRQRKM